jgi:flavin-dependent dehydrogenase
MSERQEVTVVGAGLSGLTAAINLARDGVEVTGLEKEKRHGGRPEFRPDGAASPFDLAALEAYTGIDITPACRHLDAVAFRVFGKEATIHHHEGSQMFLVERGHRATSLDTLLYDMAVDAGVRFQFDTIIKSPSDVADLPEGTIVATGLEVCGFEAMGIPYVPFWGWFAKGLVDDESTRAWAYIDDFTVDYAFTTLVNGAAFALLFQRTRPLTTRGKEKYMRFVEEDGLTLTGWRDLYGGAAPHATPENPVLFKNNMIIAGTLGGVMQPMLNFGMLGAMISGKVAAMAVTDRGSAYEEFLRLTRFYKWSFRMKRLHDRSPLALRRLIWSGFSRGLGNASQEMQQRAFQFVPGYGNL